MTADELAKLYERVNDLNMRAAVNNTGKTYWTVLVLYNRVIYERDQDGVTAIHEVVTEMIKAPLPAGVPDTPELRERMQRDLMKPRCSCGGECSRCADKCACTTCCHLKGSE